MPKVEGKEFGYSTAGKKSASRAAEDISDRINSADHFTPDRGHGFEDLPEYDGTTYKQGAAHRPFTATAQPGMKASSKRHSI